MSFLHLAVVERRRCTERTHKIHQQIQQLAEHASCRRNYAFRFVIRKAHATYLKTISNSSETHQNNMQMRVSSIILLSSKTRAHSRCKQLALWLCPRRLPRLATPRRVTQRTIVPTLCQKTKWVDLPHINKRLRDVQGLLVQTILEGKWGRDDDVAVFELRKSIREHGWCQDVKDRPQIMKDTSICVGLEG